MTYIVNVALIAIKEEYYRWQAERVPNDGPCIIGSIEWIGAKRAKRTKKTKRNLIIKPWLTKPILVLS